MVEDMPVGGGGGNKAFSEQPDAGATQQKNPDADLPLDRRVFSKTWSIRKEAFDELKVLFKKEKYECKAPLFVEHASQFSKYLDEAHPGALESALECFATFADHCQPALLGQYQKDYIKPLVDKGLGAAKPNVKAKSLECALLIFEVSEQFDEETMDVLEALCKSDKLKVSDASSHLTSDSNDGHSFAVTPDGGLRHQEVQPKGVHEGDRGNCWLKQPRCQNRSNELLQVHLLLDGRCH
jgi:hypothetical protein